MVLKELGYMGLGGVLVTGGLAAALYFTDHAIAPTGRVVSGTDLSNNEIDVDGIPEGRYSPDLSQLTLGAVTPSLGGICASDDPLGMISYGTEDTTRYVIARVGDTNNLELHKVSLTMTVETE